MKKVIYTSGIYFALLMCIMLIEKFLIQPGDEMGFWFLKVFLLVPILSFCCGMYIALNAESIVVRCVIPFGFFVGEEFLSLVIFNIANIWGMLCFLFLPATVGITVGSLLKTVINKGRTE